MRESILPRMYTATQDTVLGGVIQHVNSKKMVIVLGEPGEGKTVTMLDFCTQYPHPAYYYRCSPNTTMNSLLVFIANAIGVRVVGDNGTVQDRIQRKLQDDPNYCFVFDEAEYLANGNGSKIDVLRQIFDETDVPIIICGTYVLKDLISGERKKDHNITHNRPQIFRRLRKEEFDRIDEQEILDYLRQLERKYAVSFSSKVKSELVSICRDRQSGGLGNFIEIIELLFDQVRPEWKNISYQLIKESGRILHTHKEKSQSFKAIKHSKEDLVDTENLEKANNPEAEIPSPVAIEVDASSLPISQLDSALLHDCLHHKMTM